MSDLEDDESIIYKLPVEIWEHIFEFLINFKHLIQIGATCRYLRACAINVPLPNPSDSRVHPYFRKSIKKLFGWEYDCGIPKIGEKLQLLAPWQINSLMINLNNLILPHYTTDLYDTYLKRLSLRLFCYSEIPNITINGNLEHLELQNMKLDLRSDLKKLKILKIYISHKQCLSLPNWGILPIISIEPYNVNEFHYVSLGLQTMKNIDHLTHIKYINFINVNLEGDFDVFTSGNLKKLSLTGCRFDPYYLKYLARIETVNLDKCDSLKKFYIAQSSIKVLSLHDMNFDELFIPETVEKLTLVRVKANICEIPNFGSNESKTHMVIEHCELFDSDGKFY